MNPIERWIAERVAGLDFVDIGGIGEFSTNERVTLALNNGASAAAIVDIHPFSSPYWTHFLKHFDERVPDRRRLTMYDRVDITKADLPKRLPSFDFVHSTGILYHLSDPIYALWNLARITRKYMIVNTVIFPNRVSNEFGTIDLQGSSALFLPGISERERAVLRKHYMDKFKLDIDIAAPRVEASDAVMPHLTPEGPSPWPYWWLYTPEGFRGLVNLIRFKVLDEYTWEDHAQFALCERIEPFVEPV